MAKNLIDGDSFEFVEGAKKTDHDALAQRVTTAENDIDTLEGKVSTIEAQNLNNRLTAHTGDTDIHMSSNEKSFLHGSIVVGNYFGTGTAQRVFDINNVPNELLAVIVFAHDQGIIGYLAIGIDGGFNSYGVEIYSDGFKVYNDIAGYNLNKQDVDYGYIAIKKYIAPSS